MEWQCESGGRPCSIQGILSRRDVCAMRVCEDCLSATDRAHRIGQKRAVSVYKVIAKDTIEERVVALQHAKSKLADKLVRGDGTPLASLTRDELLQLLER